MTISSSTLHAWHGAGLDLAPSALWAPEALARLPRLPRQMGKPTPRPSRQAKPSTAPSIGPSKAKPSTKPPGKSRSRERKRQVPPEERRPREHKTGPIRVPFKRPHDVEAVARVVTKLCRYENTRPKGITARGGGSWLSIPELAEVLQVPMDILQRAISHDLWGKEQGRLRLHVVQSPTEPLVAAAEHGSAVGGISSGADVTGLTTKEVAAASDNLPWGTK